MYTGCAIFFSFYFTFISGAEGYFASLHPHTHAHTRRFFFVANLPTNTTALYKKALHERKWVAIKLCLTHISLHKSHYGAHVVQWISNLPCLPGSIPGFTTFLEKTLS